MRFNAQVLKGVFMFKTKFLIAITIISTFVLASSVMADTSTAKHDVTITVDEVALMRVLTSDAITFGVGQPATGGDAPAVKGTPDSSKYLQYTSIVEKQQIRTVTAETSESIPTGLLLKLTADDVSSGKGTNKGTSAGQVILNKDAQVILDKIGSCYTGTGAKDGSNLTYVLEVDNDNMGDLTGDDDIKVTVTFTLTEDV